MENQTENDACDETISALLAKFGFAENDETKAAWSAYINQLEQRKDNSELIRCHNTALEYLAVAKRDLNSSKLLYANEDYPNSIYLLQQAVEKTTKAVSLVFSLLEEKDFRGSGPDKISHKTPRAFIKIVKSDSLKPYIDLVKSQHPGLQTDTSKIETLIEKNPLELARLSKNEIRQCISLIQTLEVSLLSKDTVTQINVITDSAITKAKEVDNVDDKLDALSSIMKEHGSLILRVMLSFISLYLLSAITFPHATYTRYPSDSLSPKDYTKELGIVDTTPAIWEELGKVIKSLEEYITIVKELKK